MRAEPLSFRPLARVRPDLQWHAGSRLYLSGAFCQLASEVMHARPIAVRGN